MSKLDDQFQKAFDESIKDKGEIPENVEKKAVVVGVAAAGAAAAGTSAAVMSLGAASTGTAIATLHGAAAQSALLAWLGGGSLAAGGGGVAAGTMVLGTGGIAAAGLFGYAAYRYLTRPQPPAEHLPSQLAPSPYDGERVMCSSCKLWAYGPFLSGATYKCRGCNEPLRIDQVNRRVPEATALWQSFDGSRAMCPACGLWRHGQFTSGTQYSCPMCKQFSLFLAP